MSSSSQSDAGLRGADTEEAAAVRADDIVAGHARLDHGVRVRERRRRAERPGIEREEGRHAEQEPAEIPEPARGRSFAEEDEPGENERDQARRKLDDHGETRKDARGEGCERPRFSIALTEEHAERGEGERRCEDVREEHAREGEQERSQAPEDGCEPPVSRGHALGCEAHEKQQREERKQGAEQGDLPERRARHEQKCLGPALSRSWILDVEARRSQAQVPRLGEQRQPGSLGGIEVPVDVRVVGGLLLVAVDPGRSVRERLHESEMSRLVVARGLLNEAGRENDRDDGDELESLPRTLRDDHALEYTLQSSPDAGARMRRMSATATKTARLQGFLRRGSSLRARRRCSAVRVAAGGGATVGRRSRRRSGDPDDRRAARAEAERLWPVSADRSLRLRPGRPRRDRNARQGGAPQGDALVRRAARVRPALVQRCRASPDRRPAGAGRPARGRGGGASRREATSATMRIAVVQAPGAVRARRRGDLHRRARRRAARARPRGGHRHRAVQVVSRRAGAHAGVSLAAARPDRGRRQAASTWSSRRSSRRTSCVTRRSASGSCTSSGRRTSSTAPSSASSASRPRTGRCAERCRSSTGSRSARRRGCSRRRRTSPAGSSARPGLVAEVLPHPAAGARLPRRRPGRLRPLRRAGSTARSGSTC